MCCFTLWSAWHHTNFDKSPLLRLKSNASTYYKQLEHIDVLLSWPHTPPWSRSCRMFSSGWCAAGGRPPWWRGAAVLSDRETRFLRSGIEGHPGGGCFQLQRRCGSHLQTHRGLLVNSNEPLRDGGCWRDPSKKNPPGCRTTCFWNSKKPARWRSWM